MTNFSVRGVDEQTARKLRDAAKRRGVSLNAHIVEVLIGEAGTVRPATNEVFHDLDALAGTWSAREAEEMERNLEPFAQVDEALWR